MEVQIISKEIITPSNSTPQHLKTYKLSLLDQIAPPQYISIILFYTPSANIITNHADPTKLSSDHLKKSLSQTLTYFYPLAGRMSKDVAVFSIDCNDNGASFTEANVAGDHDMNMVVQESNVHELMKLLPCDPYEMSPDISSQEIVKAQVNYFKCGGVAISVCMWHVVADGPTAASFISTWAKIANNDGSGGGGGGELNDVGNVVYDCTTFFPPKDIKSLLMSNIKTEELLSNITMKRCVLDGAKISALREAVGNGPYLDRPTRVEAVGALIWKAVMDATGEEYVASIPVNLRNKMEPPLLKNCMGNINQVTFTTDCSLQDDYNCLAGKLHESIKKMDDEYVRKSHESGEYFEYVKNIAAGMTEDPKLLKMLGISSWCRFPFYESDFGWGKPVWVTPAMISRGVFLLDTKDGDGIEAWIGLPEEIMAKFEKDPRVCDYVSFTPN